MAARAVVDRADPRLPEFLADAYAPRGRWKRRLLVGFVLVGALVFFAPSIVALTSLRSLPLALVLEGMNGEVEARSASLGWFSAVEFRNVEIRDASGEALAHVDSISSERTLLDLLLDRSDLGKWSIHSPQVSVTATADGSNLEDVFLPWLESESSGESPAVQVVVAGGRATVRDSVSARQWELTDLQADVNLAAGESYPKQWSARGEVAGDGPPGSFELGIRAGQANETRAKIERVPIELLACFARRSYPDLRISGRLTTDLLFEPTPAPTATDAGLAGRLRGELLVSRLVATSEAVSNDEIRLDRLYVPCQVVIAHGRVFVEQLDVESDVGGFSARGQFDRASSDGALDLAGVLRQAFTVEGAVDVAQIARMLPRTLHLRPEAQLTDGEAKFQLVSQAAAGGHLWQAKLETSSLRATNAGRPIQWDQPLAVELTARDAKTGPIVETLRCNSNFLQITGQGTLDELNADMTFDLDRLAVELGQFMDFGSMRLAGKGRGQVTWKRDAQGAFRATAAARLQDFQIASSAAAGWQKKDLTAELQATGRTSGRTIEQLSTGVIRILAAADHGRPDQLEIHLREAVHRPAALERLPLLIHATGQLEQWKSRLAPWLPLAEWELAGTADLHANVTWTPVATTLHSLEGSIQQLHARGAGWFIDEPIVQVKGSGEYQSATRRLAFNQMVLESSTASLKTDQASIALPGGGSLGLLGKLSYVADLEKLQAWTHDPRQPMPLVWSGRLGGHADLSLSGSMTTARINAKIDDFAALRGDGSPSVTGAVNRLRPNTSTRTSGGVPLWEEKELMLSFAGQYDSNTDAAKLESLALQSQALMLQAAGDIASLKRNAELRLTGSVDYDWQTLSRLIEPYFGRQVQVEGRQSRQFAVNGPVGDLVNSRTPSKVVTVSSRTADVLAWIKPISAQASVGWDKADVFGLSLGRGELAARLSDGVLRAQPLDLAVSEGRVRLAPQILLSPGPAELMLDRGKVIEKVSVTPEMTASWLKYVAPLLAEATQVEGRMSLELGGAKVPLSTPEKADIAGRLTVHSLEVTPGAPAWPLVVLTQQIRAVIDRRPPPTQFNEPVLLRMSDQQIDFRMVDGRVYHQGLSTTIGDVIVRTRGWVAVDETIELVAEVPIRDEWVANEPLLRSMKGQVLQIPMTGTLSRPKLDQRALSHLSGLLLQNSARSLIEGQINKQLDRLFEPRE